MPNSYSQINLPAPWGKFFALGASEVPLAASRLRNEFVTTMLLVGSRKGRYEIRLDVFSIDEMIFKRTGQLEYFMFGFLQAKSPI